MTKRIVVVGGGIVGLAAAYRIGEKFPDAEISVLESRSSLTCGSLVKVSNSDNIGKDC